LVGSGFYISGITDGIQLAEAPDGQDMCESLTDFHLAPPASEAFLKADLSRNTADELAYAEQAH